MPHHVGGVLYSPDLPISLLRGRQHRRRWLEIRQAVPFLDIGMSGGVITTTSTDHTTVESSKQRAFILMRAPISWPRLVAISQDQDGRVTVDESAVGFWFWLVVSGGVLWGAWRWFLRSFFCKTSRLTSRRSQPRLPLSVNRERLLRAASLVPGRLSFCR